MCRGAAQSGPRRPPLPLAQSYHTNTITHWPRRAAAVRIAPQGNGKNIAPGRQNKSYKESPGQATLTHDMPESRDAHGFMKASSINH